MMGIEIRQLYRVECDHCGRKQEGSFDSTELAREAAMKEGFRIADWLDKGCPRQTCFCSKCVDQFIRDKIGPGSEVGPVAVKPVPERFL